MAVTCDGHSTVVEGVFLDREGGGGDGRAGGRADQRKGVIAKFKKLDSNLGLNNQYWLVLMFCFLKIHIQPMYFV